MELSISPTFVPLAHHRHSTNSLHFRSIHQHFHTLNSQNFGLRRSQSSLKAECQRLYTWAVRAAMADKVSVNGSSSPVLTKPADVVREFYASVNRRNLKDVQDLIAENCVYEDLVYPKPFVGRQAIIAFFKKFMDLLSYDLQFVIDDISKDDSAVVGVAWHLAWRGKSFPFSKGCSFYRCDVFDGKMQILYGRDAVEPAFKPGNFALAAIKAVTTLLERFPWLAEKF